jgi:hypothetical protein
MHVRAAANDGGIGITSFYRDGIILCSARQDQGRGERELTDPPYWPALMRPDTLRAYLDCRSDSDFARRMKALRDRGYPGMDEKLGRHVKAVVDQYLSGENASREARKQRMLRAARGEAA